MLLKLVLVVSRASRNDYIISMLPFVRRTAIAQSSSWNQRETRLEWRSIYNCFSLSWYPVARPSEWFEDLLHMSYIDYCIPRDLWSTLYPKTNGHRKPVSCSIRDQCRTTASAETFLVRNTNPSGVRNPTIYAKQTDSLNNKKKEPKEMRQGQLSSITEQQITGRTISLDQFLGLGAATPTGAFIGRTCWIICILRPIGIGIGSHSGHTICLSAYRCWDRIAWWGR